MQTIPQLFTCRYWALGSRCPNISEQNVSGCQYAHWDTGKLASRLQQRGTCKHWLKKNCANGQNCFYEHRYTGVPGLYQGSIHLQGLDLQISDAAAKAGFNTQNHVALFDLIWAIKRVTLHLRVEAHASRPPKHPMYPDRYKPSGIGDNSKRKRHVPNNDEPPPFHLNACAKPKRKKAKARKKSKNKLGGSASTHCLQQSFISPGNDGDPDHSGNLNSVVEMPDVRLCGPYKRQKLEHFKNKLKRETSVLDTAPAMMKREPKTNDPSDHKHPNAVIVTNERNSFSSYGREYVQADKTQRREQTARILKAVRTVSGSFNTTQSDMLYAQQSMKEMFDEYRAILDCPLLMPILVRLGGSMFAVHDRAKDGTEEIDRLCEELSNRKEGAVA